MHADRLDAYHRQRLEGLRRDRDRAKAAWRHLTRLLTVLLVVFAALWSYVLFFQASGRLAATLIGYAFILAVVGAMDLVERASVRRTETEVARLEELVRARWGRQKGGRSGKKRHVEVF